MKRFFNLLFIWFAVNFLVLGQPFAFSAPQKIRVGHFPNVTHAPALIGKAMHTFEHEFQDQAQVDWKIFNAGPEAIEALFAGELDLLYVGPNPAINGFVRSKGDALRILSGVAAGGSAFVVRLDSGIEKFEDIQGKKVASPQKGNSQDVSLFRFMKEKGLAPKTKGGSVETYNISGGDQIVALLTKQVDAIWTVEPWVSRLVSEANGKILFEEADLWPDGVYPTAVLVARRKFIEEQPDLVQRWINKHVEIIRFIETNFTEAKKIFNEELKRETRKPLPPDYLDKSFARIQFTYDSMESSLRVSAQHAYEIGYLGKALPDLTQLYDLRFLNEN